MTADDLTLGRIAENQSAFREANERIEAAASKLAPDGETPFLCECAERTCTMIVRLSLDAYAEIRAHPRRFFAVPGHEALAVQTGAGAVVATRDRYVLVDKIGAAGDVAAARDAE